VAEVSRLADAVVVGSAIVQFIETHGNSSDLAGELETFTLGLTAPLRTS
jgi:tryptophan synthase alpha subunit